MEHRERSGGTTTQLRDTRRGESRSFRSSTMPRRTNAKPTCWCCVVLLPFPDHRLSISERRAKHPYDFCKCIRWPNENAPPGTGRRRGVVSLPVEMTVTLYGVRPRISTPAPVLSMPVCCLEPRESLSLRRGDGYEPSSTPRRRAIPLAPG